MRSPDFPLKMPAPELLTRKQAAVLLSTSTSTVIRLEERGKLTPIKLTGSERGVTRYRRDQVRALAQPPRV